MLWWIRFKELGRNESSFVDESGLKPSCQSKMFVVAGVAYKMLREPGEFAT